MDENHDINSFKNEPETSKDSSPINFDDYLEIINLSPHLILISDVQGKLLFLNKSASDVTGIELNGLVDNVSILSFLNIPSNIWENILTVNSNKSTLINGTFNHVSGLLYQVQFICKLLKFREQNCVILFETQFSDQKEEKSGFSNVFENEQNVLDLIPALVFVKDMENRLIGLNKTFEEITGLTAKNVLNKKISEIINDDGLAEEYWKDDLEIISTGIPKRNIIEHLITDKSKWFITDKIPLISKSGQIKGILGFSVEITERKYAEESLLRSEQRFRLFFETSPDSIILSTLDGKFLSVNPAFERLTGYCTDEIENLSFKSITSITWPDADEELKMVDTLMNESITTISFEKEYQKKDGSTIPVQVSGWLIRDELQNPMQMCVYAKDMTFEKKADELEKSLLKKEKEELTRDLEAKNRELSTKITQLIEKTELVGNVITQLEKILNKKNKNFYDDIQAIIKDLKRNSTGNFWSQFEYTFGQVNQTFYNNLFNAYPNLTNNEKKICAFLKMNLSTKDISTITHQSARSIEIARSRLRAKMKLNRSENLPKFLSQF